LAQKSKDFRKLDDAGKLNEWRGLLKAYQTFIDLLTTHSKSTSSAFLQLYSALAEAPDPYPLLEASIDSLVLNQETVPRLTSENQRLQQTVSKLTSQLELTEKRLTEERTARKALEEAQETKIKEVQASWAAVTDESKDNWLAKEKALEEKIESQDRLMKELKANYEVTQRLDRAENEGELPQNAAAVAELEILNSELERTSARLAEVEGRNEQLRLELAQASSHTHSVQEQAFEDSPAFLRIQSENSSLLRKLDAARFERDSDKRRLEDKTRATVRELSLLKDERDALREKVSKWTDYEDVKRELEVLKSIEFSTGDDDDGIKETDEVDALDRSKNGSAKKGRGDNLEQLLLARNKKLNNELTVLRVSHQDLQTRLDTLQASLDQTSSELDQSRSLTATLENDLLRLQDTSSGTGIGGAPARNNAQPISGFDPHTSIHAIRAGEAVGGGSGILPMITAQRDRFKTRNAQLEEELSKSGNTVSSLRQEIASLQRDNLQLYEKTRYVSSYNRAGGPGATSGSSYGASTSPSTDRFAPASSNIALDRYRSAYEANISPFAAFRGRESARAYNRMKLPERVVFSLTRMILANRLSRNLFAAYCLGLHLFVLLTIYWISTVHIDKHVGVLAGAAAPDGS
jgi:homeobox protein cut-like